MIYYFIQSYIFDNLSDIRTTTKISLLYITLFSLYTYDKISIKRHSNFHLSTQTKTNVQEEQMRAVTA